MRWLLSFCADLLTKQTTQSATSCCSRLKSSCDRRSFVGFMICSPPETGLRCLNSGDGQAFPLACHTGVCYSGGNNDGQPEKIAKPKGKSLPAYMLYGIVWLTPPSSREKKKSEPIPQGDAVRISGVWWSEWDLNPRIQSLPLSLSSAVAFYACLQRLMDIPLDKAACAVIASPP